MCSYLSALTGMTPQSDKLGECIPSTQLAGSGARDPACLRSARVGYRDQQELYPLFTKTLWGDVVSPLYSDNMGSYRKISGLGRTSDQGPTNPGRGRLGRWGRQERAATQQLNGKIGRRLGVACALSEVLVYQNDATPHIHPAANGLPTTFMM